MERDHIQNLIIILLILVIICILTRKKSFWESEYNRNWQHYEALAAYEQEVYNKIQRNSTIAWSSTAQPFPQCSYPKRKFGNQCRECPSGSFFRPTADGNGFLGTCFNAELLAMAMSRYPEPVNPPPVTKPPVVIAPVTTPVVAPIIKVLSVAPPILANKTTATSPNQPTTKRADVAPTAPVTTPKAVAPKAPVTTPKAVAPRGRRFWQ
jgi:hypothetical protein